MNRKNVSLIMAAVVLLAVVSICFAVEKWQASDVVGYNLNLISKTNVTSYTFHADGHVFATFGQVGGPIAGPIMTWEINKDGILIIKEYEDKDFSRMKKLREHGDIVEVEITGQKYQFRKTKIKQP